MTSVVGASLESLNTRYLPVHFVVWAAKAKVHATTMMMMMMLVMAMAQTQS